MWCKVEKYSENLPEKNSLKEPTSFSLMSLISIQESFDTRVGSHKTILKQTCSWTIAEELAQYVNFLNRVCCIQCVEKA